VANTGSLTLIKLTPAGSASVFATIGGAPLGLAFDSVGSVH
jgi:hypothetical protein